MGRYILRISHSFLFLLMFGNLVFLNLWIFKFQPIREAAKVLNTQNSSTETQTNTASSTNFCGKDCIDAIYKDIKMATQSVVPSHSQALNLSTSSANEYYISIGSGVNTSTDWRDVSGAQVYVDPSRYTLIKATTFEASMYIPNGNQIAYARLYNVTDKHPVWNSELSIDGGSAKLLISDPIVLDAGNKLYQVQMQSQLSGPTNLVESRIHIITK